MKVTIIPIVIGTFGKVTKGLLKGLEDLKLRGRAETRIVRRVLETWGDLLSLKLQWKTMFIAYKIELFWVMIRRPRHAGPCWRSKNELICDIFLWTPSHGRTSVGRPTRTYLQLLCTDTGCRLEDLPEPLEDRDEWQERERETERETERERETDRQRQRQGNPCKQHSTMMMTTMIKYLSLHAFLGKVIRMEPILWTSLLRDVTT